MICSPNMDPQSQDGEMDTDELPVGLVPHDRAGHAFEINDETRLLRFMCLGVDDRVYRANTPHTEFTRSNVPFIDRLIHQGHGSRVITLIKDVSLQGRACKQDTTIYALAVCAKSNDRAVKEAAYKALPDVCRIPTHLFQFLEYLKQLSDSKGWGRSTRVGISKWYKSFSQSTTDSGKSPKKLAYLVTKYNRRHGWTHRDAIRLAHVKARNSDNIKLIIEYLIGNTINDFPGSVSAFLQAVDRAKSLTVSERSKEEIKQLIVEHKLAREHIPTEFLNFLEIWQALFTVMPFTAMLRSLGKMTKLGMFDPLQSNKANSNVEVFQARLKNINSRPEFPKIHPLTLFIALQHYKLGKSQRTDLQWTPDERICYALTKAFEEQTKILPSTGRSYLIAISVGEDMQSKICGSSITACSAAAAMALSTIRNETGNVEVVLFGNSIEDACTSRITRQDTLETVEAKISTVSDACKNSDGKITEELGVPFKWAAVRRDKFDVIIIFTSSLSSGGYLHPVEMLKKYREHFALKDSRFIVAAMCDNLYSVASPIDMNALDVVGFDLHVPNVIRDFVSDDFQGDVFTRAVHAHEADLAELVAMGNLTIY